MSARTALPKTCLKTALLNEKQPQNNHPTGDYCGYRDHFREKSRLDHGDGEYRTGECVLGYPRRSDHLPRVRSSGEALAGTP